MGLMLSVLIVCVGIVEALSCYEHFRNGLLHGTTTHWFENMRRNSKFLNYASRRIKSLYETAESRRERRERFSIDAARSFDENDFSEIAEKSFPAEKDQFTREGRNLAEMRKPVKKLENFEKIEIVKRRLEKQQKPKTNRSMSMPELILTKEDIELTKIINKLAIEPIAEIDFDPDEMVKMNLETAAKEFDELFVETDDSKKNVSNNRWESVSVNPFTVERRELNTNLGEITLKNINETEGMEFKANSFGPDESNFSLDPTGKSGNDDNLEGSKNARLEETIYIEKENSLQAKIISGLENSDQIKRINEVNPSNKTTFFSNDAVISSNEKIHDLVHDHKSNSKDLKGEDHSIIGGSPSCDRTNEIFLCNKSFSEELTPSEKLLDENLENIILPDDDGGVCDESIDELISKIYNDIEGESLENFDGIDGSDCEKRDEIRKEYENVNEFFEHVPVPTSGIRDLAVRVVEAGFQEVFPEIDKLIRNRKEIDFMADTAENSEFVERFKGRDENGGINSGKGNDEKNRKLFMNCTKDTELDADVEKPIKDSYSAAKGKESVSEKDFTEKPAMERILDGKHDESVCEDRGRKIQTEKSNGNNEVFAKNLRTKLDSTENFQEKVEVEKLRVFHPLADNPMESVMAGDRFGKELTLAKEAADGDRKENNNFNVVEGVIQDFPKTVELEEEASRATAKRKDKNELESDGENVETDSKEKRIDSNLLINPTRERKHSDVETDLSNDEEKETKIEEEIDFDEGKVNATDSNADADECENSKSSGIGKEKSSEESTTATEKSAAPEAFWLIFSGEYTKAMSKDWHSGHFSCWQCDEALTGQRYVLRDDHPYCIKCYESVFANACEECNKIIGIDSKDLSYKDKHWHEACFLCTKCRVSLVDKQFGSKSEKIYCGNCYDAQFASRCDGCGEIFRAGTKKMEYKTRQWHEKCFCCCVCKTPIGTKSFIPREQEIYCATCYEEKFATRCVKCNKIITSGGVTYKNEPWHRECFTCTNCDTSLAGQRFTSRDEKPYCADCFGELFAKRCTSCSRPITGIGGTRFISFEDRHWHNDCFVCASCKTSLVGRGFITDADDIICPECAKQKLM